MPFTPFHLGPAATLKALGGGYFSFMVFGFSQVVIDLEPLIRIYRGDAIVHGFTHTYLGATMVGILSILVGKPVCEFCLRGWNTGLGLQQQRWLYVSPRIPWPAAIIAGLAGVYSHVLLDSIMHSDMRPWAPLADDNGMLHILSDGHIHLLCLGLGAIGAVVLIAIYVRKRLPRKI